jgi:hypothetical protein
MRVRLTFGFVLMVAGAAPAAGQALGSMVIDTTKDRMTGRATATVRWTAIDSVRSQYTYLPTLVARCTGEGKIDLFISGVPVYGNNEIGAFEVDMKLDGWARPKTMKLEFTYKDNAIYYFNGKEGIKKMLLPTDTLLLRFGAVFGNVVTPEFHLGSTPVRRAALQHVADACGWRLPESN